jgi:RNA recognition motif-containing protein
MNPPTDGNAISDIDLEQWREFLLTPPSWERTNLEGIRVSQFEDWLPATLLEDDEPSATSGNSGSDSDDSISLIFPPDEIDHPGEIEGRCIQFTNVEPNTTAQELTDLLKSYGEIEAIDLAAIFFGVVIVRFYDLRAAQAVRRSRFCLKSRCLGVRYGPQLEITNPRKPPNNGTIVLFHLKKAATEEAVRKEFCQFGEIRQIRCAPGNLRQRFIEYFDLRAAQAAVKGMKGKKICNSKISVEFSLPGGFKKAAEQVQSPRTPTIERVSRTHAPCAISY